MSTIKTLEVLVRTAGLEGINTEEVKIAKLQALTSLYCTLLLKTQLSKITKEIDDLDDVIADLGESIE